MKRKRIYDSDDSSIKARLKKRKKIKPDFVLISNIEFAIC